MLSSAFSRLLEPLNRRLVARHEGERGVGQGENAWTCARHLKTLLFAQWTGLGSLRQIEVGLAVSAAVGVAVGGGGDDPEPEPEHGWALVCVE